MVNILVVLKYALDAKINLEDINLENGFHPWTAYIQSKLANILFTRGLHQRLKGTLYLHIIIVYYDLLS